MKQINDYIWKGVLEEITDDFLRFMHTEADEIFDFSKGIEFLDKELLQLFPVENEDELTPKIVDKLAKVYTLDGREEWILIHIEVQAKYSEDFPRRMFTYYYRILDKCNKPISAYAILTGNETKQRTNEYSTQFLGTRQIYQYNVYQIALQNEAELWASNNPFAKIALIAYSVIKEKKKITDTELMKIKINLLREFVKMKMSANKIRAILKFLVTYVRFENTENNLIFGQEFERVTRKEKTMGIAELFLSVERKRAERDGRREGVKEGVKKGEKRGEKRTIKRTIFNMLNKNLDDDLIASIADVPLEYVTKLKLSLNKQ